MERSKLSNQPVRYKFLFENSFEGMVINDSNEQNNLMKLNLFSHSWVYDPMA